VDALDRDVVFVAMIGSGFFTGVHGYCSCHGIFCLSCSCGCGFR